MATLFLTVTDCGERATCGKRFGLRRLDTDFLLFTWTSKERKRCQGRRSQGEGDKGTEWCPAVKMLPSYFGRCVRSRLAEVRFVRRWGGRMALA